MLYRLAHENDVFPLAQLYFEVYSGSYPDAVMRDFALMREFLASPGNYWFVAEDKGRIAASVVYRFDATHSLAKVYGAIVHPDYRRQGISDELSRAGIAYIESENPPIEVIYATTRTVNEAAQAAIEKLGHRKLGIFPNVHRTKSYETHCLTGWFSEQALSSRSGNYATHERTLKLTQLVAREVGIAPPDGVAPDTPTRELVECPALECINASAFVKHRFAYLKHEGLLNFWYYPFHQPNVLILSADQAVEFFVNLNPVDGHCVIIGGKVRPDVSYSNLLSLICESLRASGGRYFELIIRADKPKVIESVLNARFIPSAFFPAMQKLDGKRYDYLVLSRTFEILDFQNMQLRGLNKRLLMEYYETWRSVALNPRLMEEENGGI